MGLWDKAKSAYNKVTPAGYIWGKMGGLDGLNRGKVAEQQYGMGPQSNFNLPGFEQRGQQSLQLADQLGNRGFNQVGPSGFQSQQYALADQLRAQAAGQGPSLAQLGAEQAAQRGVSQQQAMLATGRGNQAGAARAAAQQAGAQSGSIAGNAAMGRAQEMLGAQSALAGVLGQGRSQDQALGFGNQNAFLQNRQINDAARNAMLQRELQNAQLQQGGMIDYEGQRTQRFGAMMQTPTQGEQILGGLQGAGSLLLGMSDRTAKTNIESGDKAANKLMKSLQAYNYDYKDTANGEGRQLGVMAQDLEKVLPQAVVNTPNGKMVHGGRLAGALAAATSTLDKRLRKLEKK